MRLRTVSSDMPGWSRRRQGKGFTYLEAGRRLSVQERERCESLAIPPAWVDVWICPVPNGHLQAVGTDEAGRQQYLYHPAWREKQDRAKFTYMLTFAEALPRARETVRRHLRDESHSQRRALALAFRMLDAGAFRIGTERYTDDHGSRGLLTLENRHATLDSEAVTVHFVGKSGQENELVLADSLTLQTLNALRSVSGGPTSRLIGYESGAQWSALEPEDLNAYIKERLGDEASTKHFRTWRANVVAAACLAVRPATSGSGRKRAVVDAVREVSEHLGNTPPIARSGYIDPRVIDLYTAGTTIDAAVAHRYPPRLGRVVNRRLEDEVLTLLG